MARLTLPSARMRARAAKPRDDARWYRLRAAAQGGDTDEAWIYDEIGFWGTTAGDFAADLAELTAPNLTLHLSSPGGDVYDGIAIYNALRKKQCRVTVEIDGLAASIASVIAMAGDTVRIARNAEMMIHQPWTIAMGNATEMRGIADRLDAVGANIADIYAQRAGGQIDTWLALMDAETWYSSSEAVGAGLADEILENQTADEDMTAARARWNLSVFAYAGRAEAPAPGTHRAQVDDEPAPEPPAPVASGDGATDPAEAPAAAEELTQEDLDALRSALKGVLKA